MVKGDPHILEQTKFQGGQVNDWLSAALWLMVCQIFLLSFNVCCSLVAQVYPDSQQTFLAHMLPGINI